MKSSDCNPACLLHELQSPELIAIVQGSDPALPISRITANSSEVIPGALFIAVPGSARDGHDFVDKAFELGASAALVREARVLKGRPGLITSDPRRALSRAASIFYRAPSRNLRIVGITGTNGKTTTNWIIHQLALAAAISSVRIGTLGTLAESFLGEALFEDATGLTTPDAVALQRTLRQAHSAGVGLAVMESSSHALEQARCDDVSFDVGVFTNLTRDHLDYHGNMSAYYAAKLRLFHLMAEVGKGARAAVINLDTEYGRRVHAEVKTLNLADWSFGLASQARVRVLASVTRGGATSIKLAIDGRIREIEAPLIGAHNVENLVGAFASMLALGCDEEPLLAGMRVLKQVPGRLERVASKQLDIFVDYAHTPDALERALQALRPSTRGKLWVLFGCGGDRDRGKRPQMAVVAATFADRVVITSDNPRSEEPQAIVAEIIASKAAYTFQEVDRRTAIRRIVAEASIGDTILIAGKGHEDYQIIGQEKQHFSDREEAVVALETCKKM